MSDLIIQSWLSPLPGTIKAFPWLREAPSLSLCDIRTGQPRKPEGFAVEVLLVVGSASKTMTPALRS